VLTETVFAWPGLGRLMVKALSPRNTCCSRPVLIFALAFVVINLAVDLAYGALTRGSRGRASMRWAPA